MPENYDGEIKLGVDLEAKDVKKSAQDLQNEIKKVFDQTAGSTDKSVQSLRNQLSNAYQKAQQLQDELVKLENTQVPTKEYTEVSSRLEKMNKQFDQLLIKQDEMQESGKDHGKAWDALNQKMDRLGLLIREDEGELQHLVDTGKAFTLGSDSNEYNRKTEQLAKVNNQMRLLLTKGGFMKSTFANILPTLGKLVSGMIKLTSNGIQKGLTLINRKISETAKKAKEAQRMVSNMVKGLIGFAGIRMLFNKFRSVLAEGFNNLRKFNGEVILFKDIMDGFDASMTQVKNSIATAFAPLITMVVPYLQMAANALSDFMTKLGAFFAMLTGQSTMIVAKKQTDEYGKSLKNAAGNAKKLNAELYGFDTLNRQQDKSEGSGSGIAGMFEEMAVKDVIPDAAKEWIESFKELWNNRQYFDIGKFIGETLNVGLERIDTAIINIGSNLHEGVLNISTALNGFVEGLDWELLGQTFADGINTVFDLKNTFLTNFEFKDLGENIGNGLKKMFDNLKWDEIGQSYANGINAILHTVEGIVTTEGLFDSTMDGITGAIIAYFSNIDYESIKTSVVTLFNNLLNYIAEIDWYSVFNSLWNVIMNIGMYIIQLIGEIDWSAVAKFILRAFLGLVMMIANPRTIGNLVLLLGAAAETALGMVFEIVAGAISGIFSAVADLFKEVGLDGIAGLLEGISEGVKKFGNWLKEHLIDPLVNTVKDLLGIHSPSTVFSEIGGFIIEGLKEGILNMWNKVKDGVFNTFDSLKSKVKDIFGISSPSKEFEQIGKFVDLGFVEGIEKGKSGVENAVGDLMTSVTEQNPEITPDLNTDNLVVNLDSALAKLASLAQWFENISQSFAVMSNIQIPALATGGVIPPNYASYAGNTNDGLVAKLEQLINRLEGGGSPVEVHAHLELDGKEIYDSVVTENNNQIQRTGSSRIRV